MADAGWRTSGRPHYAWIVVGITFLILLVSAGVRAVPAVLMLPLEQEFGWLRTTTSLALSINILLYGLTGPFAGSLMARDTKVREKPALSRASSTSLSIALRDRKSRVSSWKS